jgi:type VI secretion system secreted protein VgrG
MPSTTSSLLKLSIAGETAFDVVSFSGHETISSPFEYQVTFRSSADLDPEATLGAKGEVTVVSTEGDERTFNGHVARLVRESIEPESSTYRFRATLVPWFAQLQNTRDCRIFQEKSVVDILNELAGEFGFGGDLETSGLRGGQDPLEYCVQYRESSFHFLSRLLEEAGIYYWFRQEAGRHVMVLGDSTAGYGAGPSDPLTFSTANLPSGHLWRWEHQYRFVPGKASLRDHDGMAPSTELDKTIESVLGIDASKYEIYDWPGRFAETAASESATQALMEAEEAGFNISFGSGNVRGLAVANKLSLDGTFADAGALASGSSYVVTSLRHSATGQPPAGASGYECSFECIPADTPWRPRRATPHPIIPGPQTAIVVGASEGDEIYTDEHGRVKVQFRWDRKGEHDDHSTCWIRVLQTGGYGSMFLPRVGSEVLVVFLDGDPDRPIVAGRLYHPEEKPPYELEQMKTVNGFKSRSIGSTSRDDANEIRLDDKQDAEMFFLQAQKDMETVVKNDQKATIKNKRTITVEEGDEEHTVAKGARKVTVSKGDLVYTIDEGKRDTTIGKGDDKLKVSQGKRETEVSMGDDKLKVGQGNRSVEISMGNDELMIKMGNQTTKIDLGSSSTEAMQSIELKVGQSSIKLEQTGVTIKGIMVKLEGQAMTEMKGPMLQLSGDAMAQLKGGVTMIG